MGLGGIYTAWSKILAGDRPCLSIEVTRECPLTCPGCYAYNPEHLGGTIQLRQLKDLKGPALVDGILRAVDYYRPVHVSLIGGEPLVRYRELNELLPLLSSRGIITQVVTSAVRPIPREWSAISRLQISVSIDGLQPEHDARRSPATYDRILQHIEGHRITVHCTITRQQLAREGYLREFLEFWSHQEPVAKIWFSLYTPQMKETSPEILLDEDRQRVVHELSELRNEFPKLDMPLPMLRAYLDPPSNPNDCIFAKTTTCLSADLERQITPCQFGGTPDCSNCGCAASAGFTAVGRHQLLPGLQVGSIFQASFRIGSVIRRLFPRKLPAPSPFPVEPVSVPTPVEEA